MKNYIKSFSKLFLAGIVGMYSIAFAQMVFDPSQIPIIENAKLGDMVQDTIKGRITASTGIPEDL